jgi:hypothetical protein
MIFILIKRSNCPVSNLLITKKINMKRKKSL